MSELGRLRWSLTEARRGIRFWPWLRATLDRHVLRYETEHCQQCGGRVGLVWWCLNAESWEAVTGKAPTEDGFAGGIRCIRCFNREARRVGDQVFWLAVSPGEFDAQVDRAIKQHKGVF